MLSLFISTHDWYSFDFFVMFQCNNKNYLADGEIGPRGHYKYMFLLIAFVIYAYCYCYFVVSH